MRYSSIATLLLLSGPSSWVASQSSAATGLPTGTDACGALSNLLPGDVDYPNSTAYISQSIYWSERQNEVHPACYVTPRSTANVSIIMKTLISLQAPFTVKCGGHTAFTGGSNIDQGVTVDLLYMRDIVVSNDLKTVSIGPGNRWIHVSEALDPLGLAVVGSRVADVGVSGLLLGGGISYFSGFRGWACDNVQNFEIVLVTGEVVNASPSTNPELFWALRGGSGSNFGIVTRFDLDAFPQGDLWASQAIYPGEVYKTLLPIFIDISIRGLPKDPQAHMYFVLLNSPENGGFLALSSLYHATPPATNTTPEVFSRLKAVPGSLSETSTMANISATLRALDQSQPYGERQMWSSTTVLATRSGLMVQIVPFWQETVATISAAAQAAAPTNGTAAKVTLYLVFQPIPVNVLEQMQKNGGNTLGLKPKDGPLMLVEVSAVWNSAELDGVIEKELSRFIDSVESMADEAGELKGFVYLNYAGQTQDVFASYGPESYERLSNTAEVYDPDDLLQKYWKGYFQLDRTRG